MISLEYRKVLKFAPVLARKQIVDTYFHKAHRNIARTTRLCGIARKTAGKYLKRYFQDGEAGLKDRSR